MFALNDFLERLDAVYAERPKELESFLKSGLSEAKAWGDLSSSLVILNELIGYYRVTSRPAECRECIRQAKQTADAMGIQGTANYATMLLNIGTAQRAMGEIFEAEEQYEQAHEIYSREFAEPDYRMATFYNNRSILYAQTGRLKEARQDLEKAMELILALEKSETEIAITHVNIGNLCFQMQDLTEGTRHMKEAARIFEETEGKKDVHYASALSGLGEAYFRSNRLEEAICCYEKALEEIFSNYGENDAYRVTKRNLELARDTLSRIEAVQSRKMKGMDISRNYYEAYGRPMLEEKYPEYIGRIAAGLAGEGSECMGYDDAYSTDHDFGPAFCLWLTKEDYEEIGVRLQEDYEKLPKEFMGFPARNVTEQGGGRVGVLRIDDFFLRYTGYIEAPDAETKAGEAGWLTMEPEMLGAVTNGQIFTDPLGEFTKRRKEFGAYPENIRLRRLGQALGKMAQAGQYNFGRMCRRNEREAAYLCKSEFINSAIEAGYLLNGSYMPFYKWKMRGLEEFTCLTSLKKELSVLIGMREDGQAEETIGQIEQICNLFVQELNRQGLTESREGFLEIQKQELLRGLNRR